MYLKGCSVSAADLEFELSIVLEASELRREVRDAGQGPESSVGICTPCPGEMLQ